MVSMSPQLHRVLQVVVPQDFPAARVQAAVGHSGHFLSWRCRDVMSLMNLHGFTTGSCTARARLQPQTATQEKQETQE